MSEKYLCAFTLVPPFLIVLPLLRIMHRDPKPLLQPLAALVPGLSFRVLKSRVEMTFDASEDVFTQGLQALTSAMPGSNHPMIQNASGFLLGSRTRTGHSKVMKLVFNTQHFVLMLALPTYFILSYAWGSLVIHKEVDDDFPLERCMDFDFSKCFWIDHPYRFWMYTEYTKLDCTQMATNSSDPSLDGYFFKAPEGAEFYKCYQLKLGFEDLIQTAGDVTLLMALALAVVIRVSVQISFEEVGESRRERIASLSSMRRGAQTSVACWILALAACVPVLDQYMGVWFSDFRIYIIVPGFCLFQIIIFWQKAVTLKHRIEEMEADETISDGSAESGSEFVQ